MSTFADADQSPRDRILVVGLAVDTFIGVNDDERLARQRVVFDVTATTVPGYADIVANEGRYVSYATIVEYIEGRAASDEHVELVETWAEDIAAVVLENDLVETVTVRVLKTAVFAAADGVGVEIVRHRPAGT